MRIMLVGTAPMRTLRVTTTWRVKHGNIGDVYLGGLKPVTVLLVKVQRPRPES